MPRLSEEKIQKIRSSVDIAEVIGDYLPLQKKGKNYMAICPFHDDRNPSLHISSDLQIYKCFVCGAGGNVFTFLQNYLKISYLEAVRICADKAGIDVSELDGYREVKPMNQADIPLYKMHEEAVKIYQLYLKTKTGQDAKAYLDKRHIDERIIQEFQIGYAPNDNSLYKAFQKLQFSEIDMAKSGLIIENETRYYDRFNERIVFPLWDSDGRVVGFSGRIFRPQDEMAKYLNSPESEIFTKGKTLYRYYQSKSAIKKAGFVYLLEGFMDVIALYRAGIENAVAIMGTALTKDHLQLLRKVTDTIHLCLDGDKPGQTAMMKASQVLLDHGFKVRVIVLKQGMDPDELLNNFGQEALHTALKTHLSVLEFQISYYAQMTNLENHDDKMESFNKLLPSLLNLDNPIDRDYYVSLIAQKFKMSAESIASAISSEKTVMKQKQNIRPVEYKNYRIQPPADNKYVKAEHGLVFYMLQERQVADRYEAELGFLYDDDLRLLANLIVDYYRRFPVLIVADFVDDINRNNEDAKKILKVLLDIQTEHIPHQFTSVVISDYIKKVEQYAIQIQINNFKEEMKQELNAGKKAAIAMDIITLQGLIQG